MPDPHLPRTIGEDIEDVAAAMLRSRPPAPAPIGPVSPASAWDKPLPPPPAKPVVAAWRPTTRPPVALLTVCDDGRPDGEVVRLRGDRFVIGRTDGDLLLPHDTLVSGRHAEVTRRQVPGGWEWVVTDLNSTNGVFFRLTRAPLAHEAEFLVGRGRYRFEAPDEEADATAGYADARPDTTRGWAEAAPAVRPPALAELVPSGVGNRVVLTKPEYWIGADPACAVVRTDDPFCEPRHARVFLAPGGGWKVEHPKTANGLWLRRPQMVAEREQLQFQVGEQRFKLQV